MPQVLMTVSGRAIGASEEPAGFTEMVRTVVSDVADRAHVQVGVGADDNVSIEVRVARELQLGVGEALERLLAGAQIRSAVIDEAHAPDTRAEA
jgi:hypothetical protein